MADCWISSRTNNTFTVEIRFDDPSRIEYIEIDIWNYDRDEWMTYFHSATVYYQNTKTLYGVQGTPNDVMCIFKFKPAYEGGMEVYQDDYTGFLRALTGYSEAGLVNLGAHSYFEANCTGTEPTNDQILNNYSFTTGSDYISQNWRLNYYGWLNQDVYCGLPSDPVLAWYENWYKPSGGGTSYSYTFYGLSPNTTYRTTTEVEAWNGYIWWIYWDTTTSPPPPPTTPGSVICDLRVSGGFHLSWSPSYNSVRYYILYYKRSSDYYWNSITNIPGTAYTLTNLSSGVSYDFMVQAYGDGGYSSTSPVTSYYTSPIIPVIQSGGVTSTSIKVACFNMSGSWDYVRVYRYTSADVYIDYKDILNTSDGTVTWNSLLPGTTFKFKASSYYSAAGWCADSGGNQAYSNIISIATSNRPSNFTDWITKSTGDPCTNLTYTEWNGLNNKAVEFCTYCGISTYSPIAVSTGNTFYNYLFNTIRNKLYDMYVAKSLSTTEIPSTKSAGDNVLANDLNALVTKLNAIP